MEPVLRIEPGGACRVGADAHMKADTDAEALRRTIGELEAAMRTPAVALPTDPQELGILIRRAHRGDASVLPAVRQMLRSAPEKAVEIFGGNLAEEGLHQLLTRFFPNAAQRAAVAIDLQRRHAELAGEEPTPIETMLAEQAVRCWLQAQIADRVVAELEKQDVRNHRDLLRRQDAAHRRLAGALRTLATVRRLALPALKLHLPGRDKAAAAG